MIPAQFVNADHVLNVIAELIARVRVKHVDDSAVLERQCIRTANLNKLTRFGELIAARLDADCS
jgi:hypothetical protein